MAAGHPLLSTCMFICFGRVAANSHGLLPGADMSSFLQTRASLSEANTPVKSTERLDMKRAREFSYSFPHYGHFQGSWPQIERVDINSVSAELFAKEYVQKRRPAVLTGFGKSPLLSWNMNRLVDKCGNWSVNLWSRVVSRVYQGYMSLPSEVQHALKPVVENRLQATVDVNITMDNLLETMNSNVTMGGFVSKLKDLGQLLAGAKQRGDSIGESFYSNIFDFLYTGSLHTIDVTPNACPALAHDVQSFLQHTKLLPPTRADLFVAPSGSRAYPLHLHGQLNENMILVLEGSKRVVITPPSDVNLLHELREYETSEFADRVFMAELFEPDLQKHPELKKLRAQAGHVHAGEVLYIPANCAHVVENPDDLFALAWHVELLAKKAHGSTSPHSARAEAVGMYLNQVVDLDHIEEAGDFPSIRRNPSLDHIEN